MYAMCACVSMYVLAIFQDIRFLCCFTFIEFCVGFLASLVDLVESVLAINFFCVLCMRWANV